MITNTDRTERDVWAYIPGPPEDHCVETTCVKVRATQKKADSQQSKRPGPEDVRYLSLKPSNNC